MISIISLHPTGWRNGQIHITGTCTNTRWQYRRFRTFLLMSRILSNPFTEKIKRCWISTWTIRCGAVLSGMMGLIILRSDRKLPWRRYTVNSRNISRHISNWGFCLPSILRMTRRMRWKDCSVRTAFCIRRISSVSRRTGSLRAGIWSGRRRSFRYYRRVLFL